jgi:hypothetical protein
MRCGAVYLWLISLIFCSTAIHFLLDFQFLYILYPHLSFSFPSSSSSSSSSSSLFSFDLTRIRLCEKRVFRLSERRELLARRYATALCWHRLPADKTLLVAGPFLSLFPCQFHLINCLFLAIPNFNHQTLQGWNGKCCPKLATFLASLRCKPRFISGVLLSHRKRGNSCSIYDQCWTGHTADAK